MESSILIDLTGIQPGIFSGDMPIGNKRMVQIIEGAIDVFSKVGFEQATYDKIAAAAKVSRPLIQHYFPGKKQIIETAVRYLRAETAEYVASALSEIADAEKKLETYVRLHFRYLDKRNPRYEQFKVWLLFYHYTAIDYRAKTYNTAVIKSVWQKIQSLIDFGIRQKVFSVDNVEEAAKMIQNLLTGVLVSIITENIEDIAELEEQTVKTCLKLVRA